MAVIMVITQQRLTCVGMILPFRKDVGGKRDLRLQRFKLRTEMRVVQTHKTPDGNGDPQRTSPRASAGFLWVWKSLSLCFLPGLAFL